MHNLNVEKYSLFEEDHFNLNSFKSACKNVMEKQNRLVIVINDPCHNPTGYSLSKDEWKEVISFLNECSKTHAVVLLWPSLWIRHCVRTRKRSSSTSKNCV